jgi:KUP system potassium uptake protein
VTGTFFLNTILFLAVARLLWHSRPALIAVGAVAFGTVELAFFSSTLTKVVHGGWVPLAVAAIVFGLLTTWRRGREIVLEKRGRKEGSLREFVATMKSQRSGIYRAHGTAVFLNADPRTTPMALRANLAHNHVLHENVIVLTVMFDRIPHVTPRDRLYADELGDPADGLCVIAARLGYHDVADIPALVRLAASQELIEREADIDHASYFVSRTSLVRTSADGMHRWRKRLFLVLWRNSGSPIEYFRLPQDRTVMVGEQLEI